MRMHLVTSFLILALALAATNHAPCPILLLLATLSLLVPCLLNSWLVPGGFAWHRAHSDLGHAAQLPPGPHGWPVLGCIPFMGSLAHRKLAALSKAYGSERLMAFSVGATPVVISSHPETAREILSGPAFSNRPPKVSARLLMFEQAMGFAPAGDYWRHLRRVASANTFSPRGIAALEGVRSRVANDMLEEVRKEMEQKEAVGLRGVLQRGALESIIGSVFGSRVSEGDKRELLEMVREGYELIGMFNWGDHFPFGGFLDLHGVGRRCRVLASEVKDLVGRIIEARRRSITSVDELKQDHDFLGVLLGLPKEESFKDLDIIAVLWEMIFRGTDVVAILLEWTVARMVLHPNIQVQAQQEIDSVVGARPVTDADIPGLRRLQAIVKEVLRLHPPGPLLSWARLAIRDVHVGKFLVPAGTTAMVNMWAIGHDESFWKDPWAFRPDRFQDADVSVMGSDLRLAPFGSGRRVCPGRALGLAQAHLWLARLLQCYNWAPSPSSVNLSECLRLSMEMKKPLFCRAIRRN